MSDSTTDIVIQFLTAYLSHRGHSNWTPPKISNGRSKTVRESQRALERREKICESLLEISKKMQKFIEQTQNEKFNQMINAIDGHNFSYEDFYDMASELFLKEITWFEIVVLLIFCGEFIRRTLPDSDEAHFNDEDDDNEDDKEEENNQRAELNKKAAKIIKCLTRYIDENLMQWINDNDDGWLGVREVVDEETVVPNKKNYFMMATFAAVASGLYFCSKFIQK